MYLDPDDGVDESTTRVCRRARAETGVQDVAPVTPLLADVLDAGTALVDDELGIEAFLLEERRKGLDVVDFIVVRVALGNRVGRRCDESVVIGDVCRYVSIQKSLCLRQERHLLVARPRTSLGEPAALKTCAKS